MNGFSWGEKTLFIGIIYNDLLGGPPCRTCIFVGCDDGSAGQMGLFLNKTPTRKNGMTCSVLPACLVDVYGIYVGYIICIDPMGTSNNIFFSEIWPTSSAHWTENHVPWILW